MAPQTAYTFTPDVALDAQGNEHFTGEGQLNAQRSGGSYETPYEVDNQTGERNYLINEQDLSQDGDYASDDNEEMYVNAVFDLYPDYEQATEWATRNWSPQRLERFNASVENFEPADFMSQIESMMSEYHEAVADGMPEQVAPEEAEPLPSDEEIYSAYDEGLQTEAGGAEVAMEWLEQAVETQSSDPVYSDIARLTSEFHKGTMTAEDCWVEAINKHSMADLKRIYNHLTN